MFEAWRKSRPVAGENDLGLSIPSSIYDVADSKDLLPLANAGDLAAMFSLAKRLQEGVDGTVDHATGKAWLERAAAGGHAPSMCRLVHILVTGACDCSKDVLAASGWARKAADLGFSWGMFWMAYIYHFEKRDNRRTKNWLAKCHQQASADTSKDENKISLASLHAEIWCDNLRPALAAHWTRAAAFQGNPYAMESLALMYHDGRGVRKNSTLVRCWLTRAVERRFVRAMSPLAYMLLRGEGGISDTEYAIQLLNQRASVGERISMFALAVCYLKGIGVQQDTEVANKWLQPAKAAGCAVVRSRYEDPWELSRKFIQLL